MNQTTNYTAHIKSLFLWEYFYEVLFVIIVTKTYMYFFVELSNLTIIKIILSLMAPIIIILIFIRNAIVNFKGVIESMPDEKVDAHIITLLIKLMGYLNIRETAAKKIQHNIKKLDKYELLGIRSKLIYKYMRYCYFTNDKRFIDTAIYIANTTQSQKYLDFVERNNIYDFTKDQD